jgi:hypothetical protein
MLRTYGEARALELSAVWAPGLDDDVGEETDPMGGTPYLFIDPADEATVVATISERGYRVRRDDRLFERMQLFSS